MRRRTYALTDYDNTVAVNFDNKAYVVSMADLGSIDANLNSYVGAGQNGQTITSRAYGTRDIEIEGYVLAENPDTMRSRKATLQKIVVPTSDFWLVVDGKYKILVTATGTLQYASEWYRNNELLCAFTIQGTCSNPFWQTLDAQSANITGWVKDFHFPYINPVGSKFTFGHRSESRIVDLRNESEVETGMYIYFKAIGGTIVNPTLTNVDTGDTLTINTTIEPGQTVEVNTNYGQKSVRNQTTGRNLLQDFNLSSTWLQMPVGLSSFKYGYDDSSTGTLECNVSYVPQLIEV